MSETKQAEEKSVGEEESEGQGSGRPYICSLTFQQRKVHEQQKIAEIAELLINGVMGMMHCGFAEVFCACALLPAL